MIQLPDAILKDGYDVVVVGSGLAGLTAAALLAKRGLGVLLVEHHYLPGGMCTTLRRRDFSFDTGTALIYGFGERGFNPHRFVMNELDEEIEIVEHEVLLRMHFNGKSIPFWPDLSRFLEELNAAFPGRDTELRALFAYLSRIYKDVIAREQIIVPPTEIPPERNLRTLLQHPLAMLQTLRMLSTSTESVLKRFTKDPELLAFFDKLTSTYCYCTTAETPAILAATMFIDNHIGGAFYPAGSPQILASKLEKALEKHGGEALYRHRVEEIVIEGGRAVGVRLADGPVIRAKRVVANVTVWNLYGRLIRPEHIRPGRMAWAQRQVPTLASMVLYLGVDAEAIPIGTSTVEMLIADIKGVNRGDLTVYISSLDDPSIAPPGMHAMTLIAPSPEQWPAPWDPAYHSPEYRQRKEQAANRLLDQLEGRFPGLRQHIRVMEVGTPSTIERYTLKNGGAVGGPKQCIGQEMMKRLHAKSEWEGLYLCGDSTVMGMGTPAVTVSGIGAANRLLRDAGIPEYEPHPFPREAVHLIKGRPLAPLPPPEGPLDLAGASRLARECLYCEDPGCRAACPAHIDIGNVMRRLEAGNLLGAARALHRDNPLAGICGHTCLPDPPCQMRCNRLSFSERPVAIARLEAWSVQEAGAAGLQTPADQAGVIPAAVVGAGPAGLACAYFLARLGFSVDLYDSLPGPGSRLNEIPAGKLPAGILSLELEGLNRLGVHFHGEQALGRNLSLGQLPRDYHAIFLATGEDSRDMLAAMLGVARIEVDADTLAISFGSLQQHGYGTGLYAGGALLPGRTTIVQCVADGRRAAGAIHREESYRPA